MKQQASKEEVYHGMERLVAKLLNDKEGQERWMESRTDLIEMIYIVFLMGSLTREDGSPATFKWLVASIFGNLGLRPPANPTSVAIMARNRKGVKQRPFEERFSFAARREEE